MAGFGSVREEGWSARVWLQPRGLRERLRLICEVRMKEKLAEERCLCFSKRGGQFLARVGDAEMVMGAKISRAPVRVRELWFSLFKRDSAKAAQQGIES
ncbi:hypothetical protein NC651_000384 [Populus alba x Populus x berolinensis]|nr:hypothetical protein NC651_000384 [Populus alba x Populus x berolinensis]